MIASLLLLAANSPVLGDFDHDGRMDRAYLRAAGDHHELVIQRADGTVSALTRVDNPKTFYVAKLPAGTYATACAKGHGPAAQCKARSIAVKADALQFGTEESSQATAVWKDGRFQVQWLSD